MQYEPSAAPYSHESGGAGAASDVASELAAHPFGSSDSPAASTAPSSSETGNASSGRSNQSMKRPRTVMLGHWHARTWVLAHALNRTGAVECFAAVSDLRDALVVLKAATEPADLLVCSSYFPLEDVQETLLDYEGQLDLLIAKPGHINAEGAESVARWVADMVAKREYAPRAGVWSSSGYMRRLSETSQPSSQESEPS